MTRARKGAASRRQRNRILKKAKGYYGGRSRLWRIAKQAVLRSEVYATRDRQQRKRNFRTLWIIRVNAALAPHEVSYHEFIPALQRAGIALNRKVLADLALNDPPAFAEVVKSAKAALAATAAQPSAGGVAAAPGEAP